MGPCPEYIGICSGQETLPRVYFERLLARPEYILKDSWQGADAKHMEIKDPHVGTIFGSICGPKPLGRLCGKRKLISQVYFCDTKPVVAALKYELL